jgi:DNA-binding transcriptional ArsR family regulator
MYNQMVVHEITQDETDRLFFALADATRRDIVSRVLAEGLSVSALSTRYAMSFAAVQKHVAVLERAQLVVKHKIGREQIVHADLTALRRASALLERYESIWRQRVDQMDRILAGDRPQPDDGDRH